MAHNNGISLGTNYPYNHFYNGDLICRLNSGNFDCAESITNLDRLVCRANMNAISNPKRTKYARNFFVGEPNMLAITEIVLETRDYDFWTKHAKTKGLPS